MAEVSDSTGCAFARRSCHGDTLTAYTEVLETRDGEREDAGVVRFKHWGVKQDDTDRLRGGTRGAGQAAQPLERAMSATKHTSHWSAR